MTGELCWHPNPLVRWFFYQRFDNALRASGVSKQSIVLDTGTGVGTFLPSLLPIAREVYGFDIDYERIKMAKGFLIEELGEGNTDRIGLFCADSRALPLKKDSVDLVFILDCLEHMPSPINELVIRETERALKPGGWLVCSLPNEKGSALLLRTIVGKLTRSGRPRYRLKQLINATIRGSAIGKHDGSHRGYDYLRDVRFIDKIFGHVSVTYFPLPFLHNLNLSMIVKATKRYPSAAGDLERIQQVTVTTRAGKTG